MFQIFRVLSHHKMGVTQEKQNHEEWKACKKYGTCKKSFGKVILLWCLDLVYLHDASHEKMMTKPQTFFRLRVCLVVYLFGIYLGTNEYDICERFYNLRLRQQLQSFTVWNYIYLFNAKLITFFRPLLQFSGKLHMMFNHIITTSCQEIQKSYTHLLTYHLK